MRFQEQVRHERYLGSMIPTFRTIMWYAITYTKVLVCHIFGHRLEDHGYGSPESGRIEVSCDRCGWSYTHILY